MSNHSNIIRAIVFDLDGTLLDTLHDLAAATNWALRQSGCAERTIDEVRMMVGNGVGKLIEQALGDKGSDKELYRHVLSDFKQYYVQHCEVHTRLYDGIATLLQQLRIQGYRLAIVSNKLQAGVSELHRTYFSQLIDVAVGEREGIQRKPAPDMVLTALCELGVDTEEAIYVGDSDVDIATARNCGLPCISVLWGFRDKTFLTQHGATAFAETPLQVADIIHSYNSQQAAT